MGSVKIMSELHPIEVVAKRTGLTAHTIRAWEKRYGAVVPQRTPTNRRLYTSENIDRLLLLRRATILGRSIGQLGQLLPESVAILVGGRAASYYDDVIQRIHAVRLTDLMSFRTELEALRYGPRIRKAS